MYVVVHEGGIVVRREISVDSGMVRRLGLLFGRIRHTYSSPLRCCAGVLKRSMKWTR
jgi:hypothetical protein